MSMITTTAWVPRGFAAPFPTKYNFDEEEFERIASLAKLQLDDAQEELEEAQEAEAGAEAEAEAKVESPKAVKSSKKKKKASAKPDPDPDSIEIDEDLKEYDLEHYDDDDEDNLAEPQHMGMFGNVKSLAYYDSNKDDPYITMKETADDEDDEREELQILATDNLLLAAKVEDELAHLEVYVYEDEADNLYVHHDIMLPAIPLCVEWLNISVGKANVNRDTPANFVAIGTFDPDIEIWDLDTVDCMYPNAILGQGGNEQDKKKKKKKKAKKANDEYHVDAVLALAANRKHRNLLASASADKTVKLWDLNTAKCAKSYSYHTDKVCSLAWHPVEATVLLTGSYDRTVAIADMRAPNELPTRVGVESDVENVRWDPHDPNYFFVSTENGIIHYFDARKASKNPSTSKAAWTLQAHDESISSFDLNPVVLGYMATGSTDKTVKLWNITSGGPSLVVSRDFNVGKVFSTIFGPDPEVAFRLAVAGSNGTVSVWDTSTNAGVRKAFAQKLPERAGKDSEVEDKLVGVDDGRESSSSEEEDEDEDGAVTDGNSMDEDED
ncbi:WD40-repeat-containing domain protein [Lasiosphaeria miniovina]|uniref:WD40-repeat-containing domain protein n=1 Tax=Lasiosphaeria miniovina TaxID=1954250 RepID=A0AA40BFQ3_9PEZI|nr:WD40-repeat-containing domain protein [Lasiosphaeria miniovina]KAK0733392.1 WD40-repeat-containing domain protein [Lasiosphaeria miniovina]